MMYRISFIMALTVLITACHSDNKKEAAPTENKESQAYLPVEDLIREDIRKVDSFAGGILCKFRDDRQQDSVFITPQQFHQWAAAFLSSDLDSARFQSNYSETSLIDQTTSVAQFIYTATAAEPAVRKVMVYLSPGPAYDKVGRIYMEKSYNNQDTLVQEKLTWKMNAYFMIIEMKQGPGGQNWSSVRKVIWDPRYFTDDL